MQLSLVLLISLLEQDTIMKNMIILTEQVMHLILQSQMFLSLKLEQIRPLVQRTKRLALMVLILALKLMFWIDI